MAVRLSVGWIGAAGRAVPDPSQRAAPEDAVGAEEAALPGIGEARAEALPEHDARPREDHEEHPCHAAEQGARPSSMEENVKATGRHARVRPKCSAESRANFRMLF